jgi:SprT protein
MNTEIDSKVIDDLKKMADRIQTRKNLDIEVSLKISNLKRAAGQYHRDRKEIRISEHLIQNHPEKVEDTLKHELGHAVVDQKYSRRVKPHGREWKTVMKKLGVEDPSACHSLKLAEYKYFVRCSNPNCDVEFGRYRKSKKVKHADRYVCGKCGSRWESFKL